MRHAHSFLALLGAIFVAGTAFIGCSDDDTTTSGSGPGNATAALSLVSTGTNSAELKLTTTGVEAYAVQFADPATAAPSAAVIFGNGTTGTAADGDNMITVKGLDGDMDYVIYVATKSGDQFGEVLSQKVHTSKFTEFLTIVEVKQQGITFHVEVPEGKTIGWRIVDRDRWLAMKSDFRFADADFVGGVDASVNKLTKSTTVKFEGWVEYHSETDETVTSLPAPSQALTLIVCEIEYGVNDKSDREEWMPLFDKIKYITGTSAQSAATKASGAPEEECWLTEYHTTHLFQCGPADVLDAKVAIDVVKNTTRSITLAFTPDPKIIAYGVNWMDLATWENAIKRFGSLEAACVWVSRSGMSLETGPTTTRVDMQPGMTYRMLIFAKGNEAGTLLATQFYDFKATEATKPAPKVVVTGIKAPEGETESPWEVWFNVKCTTKDAQKARYACNDSREWMKMFQSQMTYAAVIESVGTPMQAAELSKLNSDEGLNISFSSWEDTETRLAVIAYNDEESSNSPDEDKDGWANIRSISIPDLPRVDSPLFKDLVGDWTATIMPFVRNADHSWSLGTTPIVTKITISETPDYPEACPAAAYEAYEGKTKEEVDAIYDDFKQTAVKYAHKVHGQNRLTCQGLNICSATKTYKSPVDLFSDKYHNAYSADDIFYDYGPKWYLEIQADGSVVVPVDLRVMNPVVAWKDVYSIYYLIGAHEKGYHPFITDFKVTVSDDHRTLTVNPIVMDVNKEKQTFYPSLATLSDTGASVAAMCHTFTLTKGWTEKASANARNYTSFGSIKVPATQKVTYRLSQPHHKTRFVGMAAPKDFSNYKKITVKQFFFSPKAELSDMNGFN